MGMQQLSRDFGSAGEGVGAAVDRISRDGTAGR